MIAVAPDTTDCLFPLFDALLAFPGVTGASLRLSEHPLAEYALRVWATWQHARGRHDVVFVEHENGSVSVERADGTTIVDVMGENQ